MKHYFIMGPSGVGKSTVAEWLSKKKNLRWLEMDRGLEADGFALENIDLEWNIYAEEKNIEPLSKALDQRAVAQGFDGCILSLPSGYICGRDYIQIAKEMSIYFCILYASQAHCLAAFMLRERVTKRDLTPQHWIRNNQGTYTLFGHEELQDFRIPTTLSEHNWRALPEIARDVLALSES